MRKGFELDLVYIKNNTYLLPKDLIEKLELDNDYSKPNISYWIMCLSHLISYHKEEVFSLSKSEKSLAFNLKIEQRNEFRIGKLQAQVDYIKRKIQDRVYAIESCSNRILRDL